MGKGGGSSPAGQTTQTTTQNTAPWGPSQPYILEALGGAQNAYQGGQFGQVAPLNQNLSQYYSGTNSLQNQPNNLGAANTANNMALSGAYMDPSTNPAWAPMAQSITDAYSRGTAAQTDAAFNQANAFGGSAYNEQTQANQKALGQTLAGAAGSLYNTGLQAQQNAVMQAPGLAQAPYSLLSNLGSAGAGQQAYQQQLATAPYTGLGQYESLISGLPQGQTSTGTQSTPYFTNPTANTLGLLGGAASIYSMFSDLRLKSNVKRIGEHPLGIGIYEYDIFGRREIGVIAQEVMAVKPAAVSTHSSGYLMVNYEAL